MSFLEHQIIDIENILSYKTRVEAGRLESLLEYSEHCTEALGLAKKGDILFTVSEKISNGQKCILGIEILIPVDKPFESNEHYVYKPRFRLVNAVQSKAGGLCSELTRIDFELSQYLEKNHMNAISDVYYSIHSGCKMLDAYLSVNENLV